MGCKASRFQQFQAKKEEDVAQCRERRRLITKAVAARHTFAAAHSAYLQSLKNVGAAFRQFGETGTPEQSTAAAAASSGAAAKQPVFLPPPSPPPLKEDEAEESPAMSPPPPLRRQNSDGAFYCRPPPPLPSPPRHGSYFWDSIFETGGGGGVAAAAGSTSVHRGVSDEDDDDELLETEDDHGKKPPPPPPATKKTAKDMSIILLASPAAGRMELSEVVSEVDDLFLRAHECGRHVSRLLEATKVHYHSNFVDARAFDSHSNRVLRAISWKRGSTKSPAALKVAAADDGSSAEESEFNGSHAATLDKLQAWESKLYDEVKTAESIREKYRKKSAALKAMSDQPNSEDALDVVRDVVKELQTKVLVSLQGIDTATAAINKLKDDELHPQLLRLLEGLVVMWQELDQCHKRQYSIAREMKSMDAWSGIESTTNNHRLATEQLAAALSQWCNAFERLIASQREYMANLTGWLKRSNMKLETEKASADRRSPIKNSWKAPSMLEICREWNVAMDRLPEKVVVESIKSLESVVHRLQEMQSVEAIHKKKVEALTKELDSKNRSSQPKFLKRFSSKKPKPIKQAENNNVGTSENGSSCNGNDGLTADDVSWTQAFLERPRPSNRVSRVSVTTVKLEEERELASKAMYDTRVMTINSMHTGLPSIFQALSGFSSICLRSYRGLHTRAHNGGVLRITQA